LAFPRVILALAWCRPPGRTAGGRWPALARRSPIAGASRAGRCGIGRGVVALHWRVECGAMWQ